MTVMWQRRLSAIAKVFQKRSGRPVREPLRPQDYLLGAGVGRPYTTAGELKRSGAQGSLETRPGMISQGQYFPITRMGTLDQRAPSPQKTDAALGEPDQRLLQSQTPGEVLYQVETSAKVPSPVILRERSRPKNLINTKRYEILRTAQDDKMAFRRGLKLPS